MSEDIRRIMGLPDKQPDAPGMMVLAMLPNGAMLEMNVDECIRRDAYFVKATSGANWEDMERVIEHGFKQGIKGHDES